MATVHLSPASGINISRAELPFPPVAVVPRLDSIIAGWWYRAGGYPVGRLFGTEYVQR